MAFATPGRECQGMTRGTPNAGLSGYVIVKMKSNDEAFD
jgi:hypothetical protein